MIYLSNKRGKRSRVPLARCIGSVDSKPSQKFGPLGVLFGSTIISKSYFPKYWQYIRRTVVRRKPARIRADSAGVRQHFAADFFSEQWRSSRGLRRCSPDYGGVRANSRELGRSSPRTGELLAKNFVRQKSFDNCM